MHIISALKFAGMVEMVPLTKLKTKSTLGRTTSYPKGYHLVPIMREGLFCNFDTITLIPSFNPQQDE